jgi:hypothetical protein
MVGVLDIPIGSEVKVDKVVLTCCSITIWKRTTRKTGEVVKSFGWDSWFTSAVCTHCNRTGKKIKNE